MAPNRPYRLNSDTAKADQEAVTAVQQLNDYAPFNPAYKVEVLVALKQRIQQARDNETNARSALAAARDEIVASEWALHDAVVGARTQVIAQYGPDSDAIAAMGLKKKSKRRRSSRGKSPSESQPAS
jgi:hypothetical protein